MHSPAARTQATAPRPVEEAAEPLPRGAALDALVRNADRPLVFRGAGRQLPLVVAGLESPRAAADYLLGRHSDRPVTVYRAAAETGGRFHYDAALDGFNFTGTREPLADVLAELVAGPRDDEIVYVGSTDLDIFFPGLRAANDPGVDGVAGDADAPVLASLWMGNGTVTAAHYDFSNNAALCAAGRRRFTLFPPDQIGNLYPGPLEPTPGGQVVSMVDFAAPDFDRFPRFAEALDNAQVAELEPGDVIVYPAMWWHQVEGLERFNILLNWWWNRVPAFVDSPQVTLMHGLLSLRQRPAAERAAWRAVFDHYLFADPEQAAGHLPGHAQGPLAPIDRPLARRLRAAIMQRLNR